MIFQNILPYLIIGQKVDIIIVDQYLINFGTR